MSVSTINTSSCSRSDCVYEMYYSENPWTLHGRLAGFLCSLSLVPAGRRVQIYSPAFYYGSIWDVTIGGVSEGQSIQSTIGLNGRLH